MTKRKLLSGNFKPAREAEIEVKEKKDKSFEEIALPVVAGSIAFVRQNKLVEDV